jgi:hypothetical protein
MIIRSWVTLLIIGASAPIIVRQPMAVTIHRLKDAEVAFDSPTTWKAFSPIRDFTKLTSDLTLLFSTLMLLGFFIYSNFSVTKVAQGNEGSAPVMTDPEEF